VDNKLQVDVAILDFAKAFEKVAHARPAHKLNYYGIRRHMLQWFLKTVLKKWSLMAGSLHLAV